VRADGAARLSFSSNDYLGLAGHPRLAAAVAEAVARFGVGSGASHLVSGHTRCTMRSNSVWPGSWAGPACSFPALHGERRAISALVGREDAVFSDELNHASLIDGIRLCRARVLRYRHGDAGDLEQLLSDTPARRKLIVTDTVFSMDGDLAPLPRLAELAERHDAWIYADDAHGFGVLGAAGRGAFEHFGLAGPRLIHLCTLARRRGQRGGDLRRADGGRLAAAVGAQLHLRHRGAAGAGRGAAGEPGPVRGRSWRRTHLRALIARLRLACSDLKCGCSNRRRRCNR